MKHVAALTFAAVVGSATVAFGHSRGASSPVETAVSNVQRIDRLYQGEGKPGDVVRSASNPDVVFRVTATGSIERRNERFGIVETRRPRSIWLKDYSYRGR